MREIIDRDHWKIAPGKALDVATGKGRNALFLAARGFQVAAIDISTVGLEEARKRARENSLSIAWQQADLENLRKAHDYKRPVIEISGTVHDVALLHGYVTVLGRSPLVARAQIKSLESAATTVLEQPTNFTIRLVFRPSHGQPDAESSTAGNSDARAQVAQGGSGS